MYKSQRQNKHEHGPLLKMKGKINAVMIHCQGNAWSHTDWDPEAI